MEVRVNQGLVNIVKIKLTKGLLDQVIFHDKSKDGDLREWTIVGWIYKPGEGFIILNKEGQLRKLDCPLSSKEYYEKYLGPIQQIYI